MQVRKQHLELDMEQHTGSKLGKEYVKAVYCHPAYLTYMQSTLCEMSGCMNHTVKVIIYNPLFLIWIALCFLDNL